MYSNKDNINILTSLLIAHGIRQVVVCPGSRNAPIVHNLMACGAMECYPVTDERSAGFYALGMAQVQGWGVAVCVTSGSALLNLLPAVAEAYYQGVDLVVISADRPWAWIDQQDGQTLPQPDALRPYTKKAVTIAEPHTAEERWFCNRQVNEALLARYQKRRGVVHINVPLSEPLFDYSVMSLPQERVIEWWDSSQLSHEQVALWLDKWDSSQRRMIVVGQYPQQKLDTGLLSALEEEAVVVSESLSDAGGIKLADEVLAVTDDWKDYQPDFVLYIGGAVVSKRLKQLLRQSAASYQCVVNAEGEIYDTFMHLQAVLSTDANEVLRILCERESNENGQLKGLFDEVKRQQGMANYLRLWRDSEAKERMKMKESQPDFSAPACVKYLEEQLAKVEYPYAVHYANSSAIRFSNRYATRYSYCNRGVNGIEGSLSTAAGMSVVTSKMVFCIIGDLSFFYDQNALWNQNLRGNLRIVLFNNGGGDIFRNVKGMPADDIRDKLVMASHQTTAQGICQQHDIVYRQATDGEEMKAAIHQLLMIESNRPMVLEIRLSL
ncbi:MAG: 2-succinyl-5-enolpyruvyl-6-hydroxy-3-cyclohexene-1-carboxylic-acid synthase [Prevotella sp.]|nr:2-succinyl-5-enolpyruvyl-6-hydroxy-3-cyclohexene-1-carboxylic-acid synthase [Prevotella sp.]